MSESKKGIISLLILAFVFATMGIFARFLSVSFSLLEQTYLRIGLAFIIGILFFYKKINIKKILTLPKKDILILIFRSVSLYLAVTLFTEAILNTKYSNASFISTLPLLPVFGYFFLKEHLKLKTVAYILIGFIGALLITFVNIKNFQFGYGELMSLASIIAFDLSYIARRWHSDYLSNIESAIFMFFIGAIFLFITSYFVGEPTPSINQFTLTVIIALVVGAIFNVANLYLTNYGFSKVKVGVAGNILTLEVIFALLYSLFLFKEIPAPREIIGGILILLSVYMVNKSEYDN